MNVAQLCLKHRINKNQRQRIVVFVSSKVNASDEELAKLAIKLKRNSIAVDLVNICEDSNKEKLQKVNCNYQFIEAISSENNSKFVNFESNNDMILKDYLSADGFFGEAYRNQNVGGEADFMDENLQIALRISLEEEKNRLEEQEKKRLDETNQEAGKKEEVNRDSYICCG